MPTRTDARIPTCHHMDDVVSIDRLVYTDADVRRRLALYTILGDRILLPAKRSCSKLPIFELIRMTVRLGCASYVLHLILTETLQHTQESVRRPDDDFNIDVFRWSRVLYQDVGHMRTETIYTASLLLFATEFGCSLVVMACSLWRAQDLAHFIDTKWLHMLCDHNPTYSCANRDGDYTSSTTEELMSDVDTMQSDPEEHQPDTEAVADADTEAVADAETVAETVTDTTRLMSFKKKLNTSVSSTGTVVFLACAWVVIVALTGMWQAPSVFVDDDNIASFTLVHLILVGVMCVTLVTSGSRVIAALILEQTRIDEPGAQALYYRVAYTAGHSITCGFCCEHGWGMNWTLWYLEQLLLAAVALLCIWSAKRVDAFSAPPDQSQHEQPPEPLYAIRQLFASTLNLREDCWRDPPAMTMIVAMCTFALALFMRVAHFSTKCKLLPEREHSSRVLLVQEVTNAVIHTAVVMTMLITFYEFASGTAVSNCDLYKTACDPQMSTQSYVFWADRANRSAVTEYMGPKGSVVGTYDDVKDYSKVLSVCQNSGSATTTMGEDTHTSRVFVLAFVIALMASAVCNIVFESIVIYRVNGEEDAGASVYIDAARTRGSDKGSVYRGVVGTDPQSANLVTTRLFDATIK
jgi:hypothetical protein